MANKGVALRSLRKEHGSFRHEFILGWSCYFYGSGRLRFLIKKGTRSIRQLARIRTQLEQIRRWKMEDDIQEKRRGTP